jgi:hypothetical protein
LLVVFGIIAVVTILSQDPPADEAAPMEQSKATLPAQSVSVSEPPPPAAINAAKAALLSEPKVKTLHYRPDAEVQWNLGVVDDGTLRFGYAGYACIVLNDYAAVTEDTVVRVIDAAKSVDTEADFRRASLGATRCSDYSRVE